MPNAYEITYLRNVVMYKKDRWRGVRTLLCKKDLASAVARGLHDQPYPLITGGYTPRCYQVKIEYEPQGVEDTAMLIAYYQTRPIPGEIDVVTRTTTQAVKREFDVDGYQIIGPHSAKHPMEWQVVNGTPIRLETRAEYRIDTAIYRSNYSESTLHGLVGTVNNAPFSIRGYVLGQRLVMRGYTLTDEYNNIDPMPISYFIGHNPYGWNSELQVQKGSWIVEEVPVYRAGVNQGTYRSVSVFKPGKDYFSGSSVKDTPVEYRKQYPTANWNVIPDSSQW